MNTIKTTPLAIQNSDGTEILGNSMYKSDSAARPLALILHGFKGNFTWGFLPALNRLFADCGYYSIAYTHSFSGYMRNTRYYDIDKFRQITVKRQLEDLHKVIEMFKSGYLQNPLDACSWNGEIVLCGHSMGASIALLYSVLYPEDNIKSIIMLSPVARFDRYYTPHQKAIWREQGFIEFFNPKLQQNMALDITLLDDIEQNSERYDLEKAAAHCKSSVFLAHGEQDLTSKISESELLFAQMDKSKTEFLRYPKCNHSYNWDIMPENNPSLEKLFADIANYIIK